MGHVLKLNEQVDIARCRIEVMASRRTKHVEPADTHMTITPGYSNYLCGAARRAPWHAGADATVDYDREA